MHTSDIINQTFEPYTHTYIYTYTYTPMFVNVWKREDMIYEIRKPMQLLAGVVAPQSRLILPILPPSL